MDAQDGLAILNGRQTKVDLPVKAPGPPQCCIDRLWPAKHPLSKSILAG